MNKIIYSFILLATLLFSGLADAQTLICYKSSAGTGCTPVSAGTPLPVTGAVGGVSYTPLPPGQYGVGLTSATGLTIPTGATYGVVCAEGANIRYTTDGTTTPTASVGMPLQQNQCVSLQGAGVLANFRAIQQAATGTLDISYYK